MAVTTYTPTGISHTTSVDFSKRSISQPVHIVQYDRTLPILAVSLYNNGQLYYLPESTDASIRFGKPDKTFVYNKALSCNEDRTIVYFEITQQMSLFYGEFYPVIELTDGESIANSSTIYIIVDKNPVQHDYIESTIEYKELIDYRNEALEAAENAKTSATNIKESEEKAKTSETNAKESEEKAKISATNAKESEEKAKISETNAKTSEINAKESETNAKTSEINAKKSETNAKTSATNIKESEENAKTSEINAKESEEKAKTSETNAKESETNAKTSEINAKESETNAKTSATNIKESEEKAKTSATNSSNYAELSKSYAIGTNNEVRENDLNDNAKRYSEVAKEEASTCKSYSENVQNCMTEIAKQLNVTGFEIDFDTGELIQKLDNAYIFSINNATGNLEWEVAV